MKLQKFKRTFIVDDDPFWSTMLSQLLTDLGYESIVTFTNGKDCVDNLHLNPKLIFLDYQMDDMNGLEVLQKIQTYNSGIGVVFCTANEDLSMAVTAMKLGSFDYLIKSQCRSELLQTIIKDMAGSELYQEKIY